MGKKIEVDLLMLGSDTFVDMPKSAQLLYFHLLINANEKGIVNNAKAIQRAIRVDDDTINILVQENFVFETEDINEYWVVDNLGLRLEMCDYGNQEDS